jgi:hypothetical protein
MKAVPRPQKLMAAFLAAFFFQLVPDTPVHERSDQINVRFGSGTDNLGTSTDVHFTPQSDIFGPLAHSTIVEPDVLMGVSSPFHSMEGTIDGTKKGI